MKGQIGKLAHPTGTIGEEAWRLVKKALRNSGCYSREEFEKLPLILQRLVGSLSKLREWALMDIGGLETAAASNFQRPYWARAAAEREYAVLPSDIKALAAGTTDRVRLSARTMRGGG